MTDRPKHCHYCGLTFGTHEPVVVDPERPTEIHYHTYHTPATLKVTNATAA